MAETKKGCGGGKPIKEKPAGGSASTEAKGSAKKAENRATIHE